VKILPLYDLCRGLYEIVGPSLLGPVAKLPGLVAGLAFHSGGFAYNPGSGELPAEYLRDGKTSIDVRTWSPDRFDPAATRDYLGAHYRPKDVARRRH
jgi:glycine/D-amino acid oxidase-like deaminating enzyme